MIRIALLDIFLKPPTKIISAPASQARAGLREWRSRLFASGFEEGGQEKTHCPQRDCQDESATGPILSKRLSRCQNFSWLQSAFAGSKPENSEKPARYE
jgi:hypothetical protein